MNSFTWKMCVAAQRFEIMPLKKNHPSIHFHNLESPINLTPLTVCVWRVGGGRSTWRNPTETRGEHANPTQEALLPPLTDQSQDNHICFYNNVATVFIMNHFMVTLHPTVCALMGSTIIKLHTSIQYTYMNHPSSRGQHTTIDVGSGPQSAVVMEM